MEFEPVNMHKLAKIPINIQICMPADDWRALIKPYLLCATTGGLMLMARELPPGRLNMSFSAANKACGYKRRFIWKSVPTKSSFGGQYHYDKRVGYAPAFLQVVDTIVHGLTPTVLMQHLLMYELKGRWLIVQDVTDGGALKLKPKRR